jgi:hypothetical protein
MKRTPDMLVTPATVTELLTQVASQLYPRESNPVGTYFAKMRSYTVRTAEQAESARTAADRARIGGYRDF